MTVRYVGLGGNNANDGLSWANRKLTLNGVEDTPVVAGDIVYVGPGVYRELLTVDVSGAAGSPITYIGDVTGEHTDGVGGIVRITGSDNDTTPTRNTCITATSKNYRTFVGFCFDTCNAAQTTVVFSDCSYITINNCFFQNRSYTAIGFSGANQLSNTVHACVFFAPFYISLGVIFEHTSTVDNVGSVVSNCLFLMGNGGFSRGIGVNGVGGVTIKNCTILGADRGVWVTANLSIGQTTTVNNCIIAGATYGLQSTAIGYITENYNTIYGCGTDRSNVSIGANSNTYTPIMNPPILLDGFRFPWFYGELSKWSPLARIAGTGEATDDLFGITRPATSAKKSWGAIQATGASRETTTIDGVSGASIKLPDAGEQFLMRVPVTNASTVFTIKCYREADYAGTNPTFIVRQAGQADNTATDAGAASAWNTLTVTCTPAADPEWVDLFIASYNTAVAGNYDCFFDAVTVT